MAITGVNVGGSEVFVARPVPDDTTFPSGTVDTWTADDPAVTIRPANDPTTDPGESAVVVGLPADWDAKAKPTFKLNVSTQMPADADGKVPPPLTDSKDVPAIAAPVPVPTGVAIDQMPRFRP